MKRRLAVVAPADRPYVLLSCAMSIDGYLDDATDERLLLSNDADVDRVDTVRAECDAILVGANTIRADNPRIARFQPVGLMQSACYTRSEGALSCVNCHDPHSRAATDRASYEAAARLLETSRFKEALAA